jgi:hypothetical protein
MSNSESYDPNRIQYDIDAYKGELKGLIRRLEVLESNLEVDMESPERAKKVKQFLEALRPIIEQVNDFRERGL